MRRKTRISKAINALKKPDIYTLMFFVLYKQHDIKEMQVLSELAYILDGENLDKFLNYYGGMTITIPTKKDMRKVIQTLLLYQYVNLEKGDFEEGLKVVAGQEFKTAEIKEMYTHIMDILSNYEFDRT